MQVKCSNLGLTQPSPGNFLSVEVIPDSPLFGQPFEISAQTVLGTCGTPSASLALQGTSIRIDIELDSCSFPRVSPPPPRLFECVFAVDGLPAGDYQLSAHLGQVSVESGFTIEAPVVVPLGLASTLVLAVAISAIGVAFIRRARCRLTDESRSDSN